MIEKPKETMVQFAPQEKLVHFFQVLERQDSWLTAEDCIRFKEQARRTAKARKKLGYGTVLEDTFENPKPATQHLINDYVKQVGDSQRGLERWINTQHAKDRVQCKAECIQKVIMFQKQMKRREVNIDVVERELAMVSTSLSRNAKVFARRIGKADALVVALEEHSSQPSEKMTWKKRRKSAREPKVVHFKIERCRKLSL